MSISLRIHNIIKSTAVLGPGKRAAIWFQGCMRSCAGCMSPDTRPLNGGKVITAQRVATALLSLEDIEGITISGGEPFLQIDGLYELVNTVRESSNLSVIVYTGYTINQLRGLNNPKVDSLLDSMIDILIDGEYVDELNDGLALRGSSNQTVHFLTDRYKGLEGMYTEKKRNAEILITDKRLFFVGIPEKETLNTWLNTTAVFNDKCGENSNNQT